SFSARGLLALGAALLLGWAAASAASAILVVFASAFLTLVLDPPVSGLVDRGMSRGRAALLVVGGVVIGGTLFTLALLVPLLHELQDLVRALPDIVEQLRQSDAFKWLDERVDVGASAQVQAGDLAARVPDALSAFVGLGASVFGFFFIIFELVFLTLFL